MFWQNSNVPKIGIALRAGKIAEAPPVGRIPKRHLWRMQQGIRVSKQRAMQALQAQQRDYVCEGQDEARRFW